MFLIDAWEGVDFQAVALQVLGHVVVNAYLPPGGKRQVPTQVALAAVPCDLFKSGLLAGTSWIPDQCWRAEAYQTWG
eukprot:4680458-Amphidinium_carterae.1